MGILCCPMHAPDDKLDLNFSRSRTSVSYEGHFVAAAMNFDFFSSFSCVWGVGVWRSIAPTVHTVRPGERLPKPTIPLQLLQYLGHKDEDRWHLCSRASSSIKIVLFSFFFFDGREIRNQRMASSNYLMRRVTKPAQVATLPYRSRSSSFITALFQSTSDGSKKK